MVTHEILGTVRHLFLATTSCGYFIGCQHDSADTLVTICIEGVCVVRRFMVVSQSDNDHLQQFSRTALFKGTQSQWIVVEIASCVHNTYLI